MVFDKLPLSQPTNRGKPDMGATVRYPLTWKTAPEHQTGPQHPPGPVPLPAAGTPRGTRQMPPAGASGTGMAGDVWTGAVVCGGSRHPACRRPTRGQHTAAGSANPLRRPGSAALHRPRSGGQARLRRVADPATAR